MQDLISDLVEERWGSTTSVLGGQQEDSSSGPWLCSEKPKYNGRGCTWHPSASWYHLGVGSGQVCNTLPQETIKYLNAMSTLRFGGRCAERRDQGTVVRGAGSSGLAGLWSCWPPSPLRRLQLLLSPSQQLHSQASLGHPWLPSPWSHCHAVLSYQDFPTPRNLCPLLQLNAVTSCSVPTC